MGLTNSHREQRLDQFGRLCRAHTRDQQADHATTVTIGRIYALPCMQSGPII